MAPAAGRRACGAVFGFPPGTRTGDDPEPGSTHQGHRAVEGRFPDGRPKVPDTLLEKVKGLSSEEINLAHRGFNSQYVDSFHSLGKKLVGRAVTLQLAPARPDGS